jgi:DNA-binding CsgD family transcriptional regulator
LRSRFLAVHDAEWRGTCKLALGVEALLAGEIGPAGQALLEARELLEAAGNDYGVLAALQIYGLLNLHKGEPHRAGELFQRVLKQAGKELSDRAQAAEALSDQERRVLRLLASDRTYRDIAEELVVSLNTVKTQLKSIYRKLGVSSRAEALDVARNLRLV